MVSIWVPSWSNNKELLFDSFHWGLYLIETTICSIIQSIFMKMDGFWVLFVPLEHMVHSNHSTCSLSFSTTQCSLQQRSVQYWICWVLWFCRNSRCWNSGSELSRRSLTQRSCSWFVPSIQHSKEQNSKRLLQTHYLIFFSFWLFFYFFVLKEYKSFQSKLETRDWGQWKREQVISLVFFYLSQTFVIWIFLKNVVFERSFSSISMTFFVFFKL
jgi:hypothetical protein